MPASSGVRRLKQSKKAYSEKKEPKMEEMKEAKMGKKKRTAVEKKERKSWK